MFNYSILMRQLKEDLSNFSQRILKGLEHPTKKFILQMPYGILKGNKVHLSDIKIKKIQQKRKLCIVVAKVYLMRWRIRKYFRFENQQFNFGNLRVMSLNSRGNENSS